MYKGCRYFLLLAAFVVGLGVMGGASEAGAAQVTKVSIVTPDSGVVRGIDSLIVATVDVFDVPATEDLTVIMWLAKDKADTVLSEATDVAVEWQGTTAEPLKDKVVLRGSGAGTTELGRNVPGLGTNNVTFTTYLEAIETAIHGVTPATDAQRDRAGEGVTAVLKTKNGEMESGQKVVSKQFIGNADSVSSKAITNGTQFTWYVRVPPELGTVGTVRVAAVVVDTTLAGSIDTNTGPLDNNDQATAGTIKTSGAAQQFNVDADRPTPPSASTAFSNADTAGTGFWNEHQQNAVDLPDDLFGRLDAGAITSADRRKGRANVAGFARGVNSQVLGIGDSLRLRLNLGPDAGTILLGKDEVGAIVFGKPVAADKHNNDNGVVKIDMELAEGQFGSGTAGCCAGIDVTYNNTDTGRDLDGTAGNDALTNAPAPTDTIRLGYIDPAGNFSGTTDPASDTGDINIGGVMALADFFADTKIPELDAAKQDTIVPVSNDTITDGTLNDPKHDKYPVPSDTNAVVFKLAEPLDSLFITFDGADVDVSLVIPNASAGSAPANATPSVTDPVLRQGSTGTGLDAVEARILDVTNLGSKGPKDDDVRVLQRDADGKQSLVEIFSGTSAKVSYKYRPGVKDTAIVTGMHTLKFKARDLGGNMGPELTRENVYVDVDDLVFKRLFPTKAGFGDATKARVDTLEEATARLSFQLSEPADSVLITYKGISGPDDKKSRTRRLSGSELTNTESGQRIQVDSLMHGTQYVLTVLGRDIAGNFTQAGPDTFLYDTTHAVPTIQRFTIKATAVQKVDEKDTDVAVGLDKTKHAVAGQKVTLTLTADATTDGSRAAVTYGADAILKVTVAGGDAATTGVALSGTGVTDMGGGRAMLSALDWVTGSRTVTLTDTAAIETLTVSIVDSVSADGPFAGALDSSIVVNTEALNQVVVDAPDTVTQGEDFMVMVALGDKYGNPRLGDNRYVSISANKLGVQVPSGDHLVSGGQGSFIANSGTFSGAGLVLRVRDLVQQDEGDKAHFIDGQSAPIYVQTPGEEAGRKGIDAPDTLIVEDYEGPFGEGDQGGFLMFTWDLSDDHTPGGSGIYRIYREVNVNYEAPPADDTTGALVVELEDPQAVAIPWAKVDMVPGEEIGRAVVASLDNVKTMWYIAAEVDGATSASGKHAFSDVSAFASPQGLLAGSMVRGLTPQAAVAEMVSPYELMAETMVASRKAGAVVPGAPVVATLTPEALAFVERGEVLRLKDSGGDVLRSPLTATAEAVRAYDDIAPEPITFLRVVDTPNDAGASIDVVWTKSVSDHPVARSAAGAVGRGGVSDVVPGVKGYTVYRKSGDGAFEVIDSTGPGAERFSDATAANGVRYTYRVSPFDDDNVADSELEGTAMAIRNRVVDASGAPVYGLFGPDSSVGFDDFFIFADFFGIDASHASFDAAFDLNGDDKIGFDDFFVLADNFGRSVKEAAAKAIPSAAGLNPEASLFLETTAALPRVGEELVVDVGLADFVELQGYGFTVHYDAERLEFVRVAAGSGLFGESGLAQPQLVARGEGELSLAAFGRTVDKGELDVSLVFRPLMEIEDSRIYFSEGQLRDGSYGVDAVARLGEVQIQTLPEVFALADNYPNPFNPETTIKYALPEAVDVRLEIYNMLGQMVRTLVSEGQSPGRYVVRWDATDESGGALSTGIYFYRLQAGDFLDTRKMLLLK